MGFFFLVYHAIPHDLWSNDFICFTHKCTKTIHTLQIWDGLSKGQRWNRKKRKLKRQMDSKNVQFSYEPFTRLLLDLYRRLPNTSQSNTREKKKHWSALNNIEHYAMGLVFCTCVCVLCFTSISIPNSNPFSIVYCTILCCTVVCYYCGSSTFNRAYC